MVYGEEFTNCMLNPNLESLKKNLRWIGIALTIVSLVFVSRRFIPIVEDLSFVRFSWPLGLSIILSLIGLVIGQFGAGGVLWQSFHLFKFEIKTRSLFYATLRSQIAKYLPGNVFHIGGCIALLKLEGVPIKRSTIGIGAQYVCIIGVGLILGVHFWLKWWQPQWLSMIGLIGLPSILLISISFFHHSTQARILPQVINKYLPKGTINHLIYMEVLTCIFFVISAGSLFLLTTAQSGNNHLLFLPILASFSLSWMAGMIVLGSPGGWGSAKRFLYFYYQGKWTWRLFLCPFQYTGFYGLSVMFSSFLLRNSW
jgi:glycosyltransferase 2 family protein